MSKEKEVKFNIRTMSPELDSFIKDVYESVRVSLEKVGIDSYSKAGEERYGNIIYAHTIGIVEEIYLKEK